MCVCLCFVGGWGKLFYPYHIISLNYHVPKNTVRGEVMLVFGTSRPLCKSLGERGQPLCTDPCSSTQCINQTWMTTWSHQTWSDTDVNLRKCLEGREMGEGEEVEAPATQTSTNTQCPWPPRASISPWCWRQRWDNGVDGSQALLPTHDLST